MRTRSGLLIAMTLCSMACSDDPGTSPFAGPTSSDAGSPPAPTPTRDAAAPTPDAGPVDPADESCPITNAGKEWTFESTSDVRSILVRGSVYAIADSSGASIPLRQLAASNGESAATSVNVARPASSNSTHFPRLQTAKFDGKEQLFVSYLRTQYTDNGTVTEAPGGLVRVGPIGEPLPESAALLNGIEVSVDGIFDDDGGPRVLTFPSLGATSGMMHRLAGGAGAEVLEGGVSFPGKALSFERINAAYADKRLVGWIRTNNDGSLSAQTWTAWPVRNNIVEPGVTLPETVATTASHDTLPYVYAVTSAGVLTEYTLNANNDLVKRVVATLPSAYRAAGSSAKMAYTNGSVVFPGTKDGAPRLLRVRLASGRVDEWKETAADTPDNAFGWSALAAGSGMACYGSSAMKVRCGCLDTVFTQVQ